MKRLFAVFATSILLVACGSSGGSNNQGPAGAEVRLAQVGSSGDVFYLRGPIALQYVLEVVNPTTEPIRLRRLDLSTIGDGAYYLRTGSVPMNEPVPAGGTTALKFSAWGTARGGRLTANEPVTVRVIAQFEDSRGNKFQRINTETLSQFGR
ncbi:MAG: hypothetical protein JWO56_3690 [Acidobacteria bacterium]|nr:hypothetical protein [Acidobacteriota bacterium]